MPLYLQLGRGMGIGASGALLLPITLAQVTSAAIVGPARHQTGPREYLPEDRPHACDGRLLGAGRVRWRARPRRRSMALTVLVGVGLGMVMPPTQVTVQLAAGPRCARRRDRNDLAVARDRAARSAWRLSAPRCSRRSIVPPTGRRRYCIRRSKAGPRTSAPCPPARVRSSLRASMSVFRIVFLVIAAFTAIGGADRDDDSQTRLERTKRLAQ